MPKKKTTSEAFNPDSDESITQDVEEGDLKADENFPYEQKMMIIEAIAPHTKALFGKLEGNNTQAGRKILLRKIMADLRSMGINVGTNRPYFKGRTLANMKRKTADKLKLRKATGSGFVPLSGLDKRIIEVFNLNGLHATGLPGHKDPRPKVVKSSNFFIQKNTHGTMSNANATVEEVIYKKCIYVYKFAM